MQDLAADRPGLHEQRLMEAVRGHLLAALTGIKLQDHLTMEMTRSDNDPKLVLIALKPKTQVGRQMLSRLVECGGADLDLHVEEG